MRAGQPRAAHPRVCGSAFRCFTAPAWGWRSTITLPWEWPGSSFGTGKLCIFAVWSLSLAISEALPVGTCASHVQIAAPKTILLEQHAHVSVPPACIAMRGSKPSRGRRALVIPEASGVIVTKTTSQRAQRCWQESHRAWGWGVQRKQENRVQEATMEHLGMAPVAANGRPPNTARQNWHRTCLAHSRKWPETLCRAQ